jgi:hypothetical protein
VPVGGTAVKPQAEESDHNHYAPDNRFLHISAVPLLNAELAAFVNQNPTARGCRALYRLASTTTAGKNICKYLRKDVDSYPSLCRVIAKWL